MAYKRRHRRRIHKRSNKKRKNGNFSKFKRIDYDCIGLLIFSSFIGYGVFKIITWIILAFTNNQLIKNVLYYLEILVIVLVIFLIISIIRKPPLKPTKKEIRDLKSQLHNIPYTPF
jgi:hypothetical protein